MDLGLDEVEDNDDGDVGVEDDGKFPALDEGYDDATDAHAETGQHAGDALNKGVLGPLRLHVHVAADLLRPVFVEPLQFLAQEGLVVKFADPDELALAADGPGDGHEAAAEEDEEAVEEEPVGCLADVGDEVVHVGCGVEGVDEVAQGGRVEDQRQSVRDGEDAPEEHQHFVVVVREAEQLLITAGFDLFRVDFFLCVPVSV